MMLSDAPASFDAVTTSRTCAESTDVNTLMTSGMIAPASVPQLMMAESFHHSVGSPCRSGISAQDTRNVRAIDTSEVSHTRNVSGCSKFILSTLAYRPCAIAWLMKYEPALDTTIMRRMTKIQTRSCTCTVAVGTASMMNVMSATPVTP